MIQTLTTFVRTSLLVAALFAVGACDDSNVSTKAAEKSTEADTGAKTTDNGSKTHGQSLVLSAEEARRAGLVVKPLQVEQIPETVDLFGTVEVNRDKIARVVAPVGGRVVKISANLGDTVNRGVMLALIESPETGEALASYAQARSEVALAVANFDRIRSLVAGGSLARKEEQKARAEYDKARAALDASNTRLRALGVDPGATAKGTLALIAPFAGSIIEKTAVLGEYAQANQALFTVADLSSVWIQAQLYDRDLGRVAPGASATVRIAAFPGKTFAGRLTYVSNTLDPETRTAKARIEIANPEGVLKPGMFANVAVAISAEQPVLQVPESALVLLQGQMTAFVQNGGGFDPRPVETGARHGERVIITSGLEPNDQVVVAGAYALKARLLKSQIEAD